MVIIPNKIGNTGVVPPHVLDRLNGSTRAAAAVKMPVQVPVRDFPTWPKDRDVFVLN